MRTTIVTLVSVLLVNAAFGQQATKKAKTWKSGAHVSVLGAQTGSRNWAPANEKFSVTGVGMLSLWAGNVQGRVNWINTADLSYGIANTSSGGPRKVEDKLDIFSRYTRFFRPRGGWTAQPPLTSMVDTAESVSRKLGAGIAAGLRTQFSNSFDYSMDPKKRISGFFAPAYLVLSPGIHLNPSQNLMLTAGPAMRWVFVSNSPYSFNYQGGVKPSGEREKSIAEIYGVHPERESRFEAGLFVTASYNRRNIVRNIDYKTRLEVMNDMLGEDANSLSGQILVNRQPGTFDVYWTNTFYMNVNKWVRATYSLDIVYDDDVKIFGSAKNRAATQMRSLLGVGLLASF